MPSNNNNQKYYWNRLEGPRFTGWHCCSNNSKFRFTGIWTLGFCFCLAFFNGSYGKLPSCALDGRGTLRVLHTRKKRVEFYESMSFRKKEWGECNDGLMMATAVFEMTGYWRKRPLKRILHLFFFPTNLYHSAFFYIYYTWESSCALKWEFKYLFKEVP